MSTKRRVCRDCAAVMGIPGGEHKEWCLTRTDEDLKLLGPRKRLITPEIRRRYTAINLYADLRERYIGPEGVPPGGFHDLDRYNQWISCDCDGMRAAARLLIVDLTSEDFKPLGIHTAYTGMWEQFMDWLFA